MTSALRIAASPPPGVEEVALPELDARARRRVCSSSSRSTPSAMTRAWILSPSWRSDSSRLRLMLLLVDVAHQADVELQEVGLDGGQRLQRRVAGAHVVHRHPVAPLLERAQRALELVVADDGHPLGDLHHHVVGREPALGAGSRPWPPAAHSGSSTAPRGGVQEQQAQGRARSAADPMAVRRQSRSKSMQQVGRLREGEQLLHGVEGDARPAAGSGPRGR